MGKWEKAAKVRLTEIQAAEDAKADMLAMANSFLILPPGQLKKVLTDDILAILAKYGVVLE